MFLDVELNIESLHQSSRLDYNLIINTSIGGAHGIKWEREAEEGR
jgi:hypothetical protein